MTSLVLALALLQSTPGTTELSSAATSLRLSEALWIGATGRGGRIPFGTDPIQQQIIDSTFVFPKPGDKVARVGGGDQKWAKAKAGTDGAFSGRELNGGYLWSNVESDSDRTMVLKAIGHGLVYVNGEIRTGDPYQFGYVELPVKLKKGSNSLLFSCSRGRLEVQLTQAPATPFLNIGDLTLADAVLGETGPLQCGIVIVNPTDGFIDDLSVESITGEETLTEKSWRIPPMTSRKVPFKIPHPKGEKQGNYRVKVRLKRGETVLDSQEFDLRVRDIEQARKETFFSNIDGSLQYYALFPTKENKPGLGMAMSLHGASVEAINQAEAYSLKEDFWIVCPTNRRPYGFDWEDWGRMDALEVLAIAKQRYKPDEKKIYLTGHSMGGHGTWNFGALFPGLFGALAPSAGWRSFYTYGGKPRPEKMDAVEEIVQRSVALSDTLEMSGNYTNRPIFILHGDVDDNVPVTEAREMFKFLQPINPNVKYHEQKGANHWWDGDAARGADCLDWPDIFNTFRGTEIALPKDHWSFTTFNPAVSRTYHGYEILTQIEPMKRSKLAFGTLDIETENVASLTVPTKSTVDGQELGAGSYEMLGGKWAPLKDPKVQRGPFKEVWQNRFVFVYGTAGDAKENAWMLNKARYDAESFWYRGNGSPETVSDAEYLHGSFAGRNVILIGNTQINKAWQALMKDSPVHVDPRGIEVGEKRLVGDDLGCLFWVPGPGGISVGALGVTGEKSMRSLERLPYFTSGVGYPDWCVFRSDVWTKGMAGVEGAGFYSPDGKLSRTSAWRS